MIKKINEKELEELFRASTKNPFKLKRNVSHLDLQGSVSWKTADTKESIPIYGSIRETFPVYLLCPDGRKIEERCYAGREFFGGHDVHTLLANWNLPEQCTGDQKKDAEIGRKNFWRHENGIKYPVKLVRNPELNYEDVEASEPCELNGWDYEMKDNPQNNTELNKYSEEKVRDYLSKKFSGVIQGKFVQYGMKHYKYSACGFYGIYGDQQGASIYVKRHDKHKEHEDCCVYIFWIPFEHFFYFYKYACYQDQSHCLTLDGCFYHDDYPQNLDKGEQVYLTAFFKIDDKKR